MPYITINVPSITCFIFDENYENLIYQNFCYQRAQISTSPMKEVYLHTFHICKKLDKESFKI